MTIWLQANGESTSGDQSDRERAAAVLRIVADRSPLGRHDDFLRAVLRGLADVIAPHVGDEQMLGLEQVARRARKEIVADIGHDLLTPLNGILGYAQLLGRDPTLSEHHREAVHKVRECGEQLLRLVTGHLDSAREGRGDATTAPSQAHAGAPSQPDASEAAHTQPDESEIALPPALRMQLLDAARRGDIVEVNRCLDELERHVTHPRLLAELRAHARVFDTAAIRERLGLRGGTTT